VRRLSIALVAAFVLGIAASPGGNASAQNAEPILLEFGDGSLENWTGIKLANRANRFAVIEENGRFALEAESEKSASALWQKIDVPPTEGVTVSWDWKVRATLPGNQREREKRGDDYAARFFVIFDDEPFSRNARAICYVWASSEPVGSKFPNPYFSNVQTIVLQSGDERAGAWVTEERDFVKDYREAFGELPKFVSALAVMVDTDNTGNSTTAWFTDIVIAPRDISSGSGESDS
jgi:hypothetical protein